MADDRVPEELQAPKLPEVEVADARDVVAEAEPAEAIIAEQPSVDELLGRGDA